MPFIIAVRFLTGYCVAARSKTERQPEWPPHPARLFMALAAAHFECVGEADEQAALEWLEALDPPRVWHSTRVTPVTATPTFVPTNDAASVSLGGSIQTLPALKRHRAERAFPRTHLPPDGDTVYFEWPDGAGVEAHRSALERLCAHVARLGHSSSLVQAWVVDAAPGGIELTTLVPVDVGGAPMRVTTRGTFAELVRAFAAPPYRPTIRSTRFYASAAVHQDPPPLGTVFDDQLDVLRLTPAEGGTFRHLALETTLALTGTLREAVMAQCPQPVPESISGHSAGGAATTRAHVAYLPLAFVGGDYGDGHLMGLAVATPRAKQMSRVDRAALAAALDRLVDNEESEPREPGLRFRSRQRGGPGLGQWRLTRQTVFEPSRVTLNVETYTAAGQGGAKRWATVTPFVFDQHAKAKNKAAYLDECAELVRVAVRGQLRTLDGTAVSDDIGIGVRVTPVAPLCGVPSTREFPRLRRKDDTERRHTHVELTFDRPVIGPLLAGAGRFRGYGLFRPVSDSHITSR